MDYFRQEVGRLHRAMKLGSEVCQRTIAAKRYIDSGHFESLDLQHISSAAFVSKFHFHRTFLRLYGRTPADYVTETRIVKAKQMLISGASVSDVCLAVGLQSVSSFNRMFKKKTGITPGAYAAHKKKQDRRSVPPIFPAHLQGTKHTKYEDQVTQHHGG